MKSKVDVSSSGKSGRVYSKKKSVEGEGADVVEADATENKNDEDE